MTKDWISPWNWMKIQGKERELYEQVFCYACGEGAETYEERRGEWMCAECQSLFDADLHLKHKYGYSDKFMARWYN